MQMKLISQAACPLTPSDDGYGASDEAWEQGQEEGWLCICCLQTKTDCSTQATLREKR